MKRQILKKFIYVTLIALLVSSCVFGFCLSRQNEARVRKEMEHSLDLIDRAVSKSDDLQSEIGEISAMLDEQTARITIISADGTVLADNGVDHTEDMENHLNRTEIREALDGGIGSAIRYSETLHRRMMYTAKLSKNDDYVIRLSLPYDGMYTYLEAMIPSLFIAVIAALLASVFLAERFSKSITMPLGEIAGELRKVERGEPDIIMKQYRYEELNVIIEAVNQMSAEIGKYVQKLEMERIIRQEFFSNASHELKTPITSIKGYTELLESGLVNEEAVQKDFLSRISTEADRMTNLINDILMISKLETKEIEVEKKRIRISPVVSTVLQSIEPLAAEDGVQIIRSISPVSVMANVQQMQELLSNLLVNAVKYNKPNGKVWLSIRADQGNLIVDVRDTGVGIPKEAQRRVFERFYRVDKGRSRKMGGTGLGLSIVKHIVNYYGGKIELESQVDVGTSFHILLPAEAQPEQDAIETDPHRDRQNH